MAPLTLMLSLLTLLLQCFPTLQQQLQFAGESGWWSVVSSHFVHWSWSHLFWDLLVFLVVGALLEIHLGSARLLGLIFGATIAGTGALVIFEPALVPYRGLSGVSIALCACAGLCLFRRVGERVSLFAVLIGKSFYEVSAESPLFVSSDLFTVAASVHFAGVVWAVACYALVTECSLLTQNIRDRILNACETVTNCFCRSPQ